jgi:hypothetical protein
MTAHSGGARTFHVDSAGGNDTHSGESPATAWRTLHRVNGADLRPGDTVRFKCGGAWRGSLLPKSGDEKAPVTYTVYGEGEKPLLLGSVSRDHAREWEQTAPNIWATLKPEYHPFGPPIDCRTSRWHCHRENGADLDMVKQPGEDGPVYRVTCRNSGTKSNHIQAWGSFPEWEAIQDGASLKFRFRTRSTKPFTTAPLTVRRGGRPWNRYSTGASFKVTTEWQMHSVPIVISSRGQDPRLHFSLGGLLPEGAVFEFQPLDLVHVKASQADPLAIDVGNIIFDHGKACGWKKWSVADLDKPLDYVYDSVDQRVFVFSEANPATSFSSIELALKRHIVSQGSAHNVVYDGLALKYGAAHGFGGGDTAHLTIRNCDIAYIGGGHQHTNRGRPVRFGNGIEFWGAAHDNLVEGCRIWEIYDAALTNQGRGPSSKEINITYRNNVIWNSEYSFEYWNNPETAETRNIQFINNTCVNAGVVWSHAQRPNPNGSHLMMYTNTAKSSGIVIKHNIFCQSTEWGSRFSAGWKPLPEMDHNLWYEPDGDLCYFFKEKLPASDIEGYRTKTGLDQNSVFAKPGFVNAAAGDFRLSPNSPARTVRPDGGVVGAESLWNAAGD